MSAALSLTEEQLEAIIARAAKAVGRAAAVRKVVAKAKAAGVPVTVMKR